MIDWTRGMVPQGCHPDIFSRMTKRTLAVTSLMPEMVEGYAVTATMEVHADPPINLDNWCPYDVFKYFWSRSVRWGRARLFTGRCAWVSKSELQEPRDPKVWVLGFPKEAE